MMTTSTDSAPLQDIRDLATNYSDRQGLRVVPMALAILIHAFPQVNRARVLGLDMQLIALTAGFLGYWLIGRYYDRRFGRVEEIPSAGFPIAGQILLIVIAFFVSAAIDIVQQPPVFVTGILIAAWLIVTAWPSRRIRGEYLSMSVVLVLISLMPLVGQQQGSVARAYAFWFGCGLLLAGVRDHLSFIRFFSAAERANE
jgi:hypothetical protein